MAETNDEENNSAGAALRANRTRDSNPRSEPECCRKDGCCAPGKPCSKYIFTPFTIMAFFTTLGWLFTFVVTFMEWSTGNRVFAIWQYIWIFGTMMVVYVIVFVLVHIFSGNCRGLNFPVASEPNPGQALYVPIRDFAGTSMVWGVIDFAWAAAYRWSISAPLYDALNSVSGATWNTLSPDPPTMLGVNGAQYWQLSIGILNTLGALQVLRAGHVYMMSELAPIRLARAKATGGV